MNCREFENIVNDLARLKMIDAALRAAGMAHAEICGRCAARLADERALSAGLRSLAASDEGKSAPPGVEAVLLKAFHGRSSNPLARSLSVRSKARPRLVLVAAAALLIALGFVAYRAVRNEPRKAGDAQTAKTPSPQPVVEREERLVKENRESGSPRASRARPARRGNRPRLNEVFIIDGMTTYAKDSEYVTDFFPLAYGDDQNPMERGQVIRVQMQRSALIAFGLPVNIERADTTVKADLLVGEDGMARAIRFVR